MIDGQAENSPTCYCEEREKHPGGFLEIPEGYCGICDVCGKPGHMRAHPHYATSGAWCDEHWADVVSGRSFGLHELLWYIFVALSTCAIVVYWIIKLGSWLSGP